MRYLNVFILENMESSLEAGVGDACSFHLPGLLGTCSQDANECRTQVTTTVKYKNVFSY